MKVIYKREIQMNDGSFARFTLGKVYDYENGYIRNEKGSPHNMSKDFMLEYFEEVVIAKPLTIDVAHRLVVFDCELGCIQAEMDNLKERYDQINSEYVALKAEYGVKEL